jgi:hypothetical protein
MTEGLRNCGDCGAKPGEFHEHGCDVERCALCGGQAICDNCVYELNGMPMATLEEEHPEIYGGGPTAEMYEVYDAIVEKAGGRLPWTGLWPGSMMLEQSVAYGSRRKGLGISRRPG